MIVELLLFAALAIGVVMAYNLWHLEAPSDVELPPWLEE